MITWENYEEYIMMHADGELQPAEVEELMEFMHANPELQNELATYEMIRLTPDTSVVFENKEALLKTEPRKKVIAFPHWQRYAVAASLAALMVVGFLKLKDNNSTGNEIAKTDTAKSYINAPVNTAAQTQAVAATPKDTTAVTMPADEPAQPIADRQSAKKAIITQLPKPRQTSSMTTSNNNAALATNEPKQTENIDRLNPAAMQPLPYTTNTAAPAVREVPTYSMAATEATRESFISRLPIDDTKKEGLGNVATALTNTYEKIKGIKQDIADNTVTVKIQKRKLILSF